MIHSSESVSTAYIVRGIMISREVDVGSCVTVVQYNRGSFQMMTLVEGGSSQEARVDVCMRKSEMLA